MAVLPGVRPASRGSAPTGTGQAERPRSWTGWVLGAVVALVSLGVLVVALTVGGGRPVAATDGLPDPGALTSWGQPVVNLLLRVLAVLTVGQLTYAALLAPSRGVAPASSARRAVRWSAWSVACWLVAEAASLVLTASALYGVPVTRLSGQGVTALLTALPVGRASLLVGLLLSLVLLGSLLLRVGLDSASSARAVTEKVLLVLVLAAVVVPVVLAGHSAAAEDHVAAVASLSVHVVTASLWVGGLTGLLLHGRGTADASTAVPRFSTLALACVALLTASGIGATFLVAGTPTWAWIGEGWVWLLLAKTVLLIMLTGMGWWHRRRTLPALRAGRPRAFARLTAAELVLMAVTVTVSVALSTSPAPSPTTATDPPGTEQATDELGGDPPADPTVDRGTADDLAGPAAAADRSTSVEDMSGHDHGDLSVSVLVDENRFHVTGTVRPGQPVTVYNSSDNPATITALDNSFDAAVPARTFITFTAPTDVGEHPFISRLLGIPVYGFSDTLLVRAD